MSSCTAANNLYGPRNKHLNDQFPAAAESVRAVQGHTAGREYGGTLVEQINESSACEYHVDRCVRDADVEQTRASNRCGYIFSLDTCGKYRAWREINTDNWGGLCTPRRDAQSSGTLRRPLSIIER